MPHCALILLALSLAAPPAGPPADDGADPIAARAEIRRLIVEEQARRALVLLEPWLATRPEDPAFHALHGEVRHALEEHEAAVDAFRRAILLDPSYEGRLFHLGRSLQALGLDAEALPVVEAMIGGDQRSLQVRGHFGLGLSRQSLGDDAGARAAFEAALSLDPEFRRATYRLALLDLARGETDGVERALRSVLERDPLHHGAAYNLALVLGREGRDEEAERARVRYREILEGKQRMSLLRDRLTGGREDLEALLELGELNARLGAAAAAARWFGSAGALDPLDPRPALGTVAALRALGRPEDAEALCRALLARRPPIEALRPPLIELLEARGAQEEADALRGAAPPTREED
ncbi:MAG: tetratricopeptide repeat protein [Planctomycetota bacterium]